jgi:hypothetical protein
MKKAINSTLVLLIMITLSGCAGAAFNRIEVAMNRNITVGQELIDLQAAHEKGIISDEEYIEAKKDILKVLGQFAELGDSK